MKIRKIASIVHFNSTETNQELIFQQLYFTKGRKSILQDIEENLFFI
ncbi:hypothetical protein G436_3343 [Leptospira interrogans serovar Hardjo str. Norma]|uniref:Uncharacterized protein n=1 Tax=Leptospira interrogans serovar Hardjo str. Norma TaxID=1279460 RepID=A0A0M4NY94_LEPIR|nr:hypothetical protein G436_3343 [Leptospira interrogans serovar Hardjo str. Norma]